MVSYTQVILLIEQNVVVRNTVGWLLLTLIFGFACASLRPHNFDYLNKIKPWLIKCLKKQTKKLKKSPAELVKVEDCREIIDGKRTVVHNDNGLFIVLSEFFWESPFKHDMLRFWIVTYM